MEGGGRGGSKQELLLIERISEIYESISNLPSLSPSKDVDSLFTELVHVCIPPVSIDISKLSQEVEGMRSKLISLCSQAEGHLESHYTDLLASHDNPLEHLHLFPYYKNYLKLSHIEYTLLSRYLLNVPTKVAFIGSGPLPLTSIVLATRHLPATQFHNYDLDPAANARACRLVEGTATGSTLTGRMVFHTANILEVSNALRQYDVVFLAALVGTDREEKARVMEHLARNMAPGAFLVVRSAHGARAFLYPVVEPSDLKWFDVMTVYHPTDEVINSVIVARKPQGGHGHGNMSGGAGSNGGAVMRPCQCCGMVVVQGMSHHFGHGGKIMEEVPVKELQS